MGMLDSLEIEHPRSLLRPSASHPVDSLSAQLGHTFDVRSRTIPPYSSSSRSRFPNHQPSRSLSGNDFRCDIKSRSNEAFLREIREPRGRHGNCQFSKQHDVEFEDGLTLTGSVKDYEYSNLFPENVRLCESNEQSSSLGIQLSPTGDELENLEVNYSSYEDCSAKYERGCDHQLDATASSSEETPDFCVDSDEIQSLLPESERLTRASSLSLSELLGKTPNMTSDSESLSVDDYPCLLERSLNDDSVIRENSYEDSDYEELLIQNFPSGVHRREGPRAVGGRPCGTNSPTRAKDGSDAGKECTPSCCRAQKSTTDGAWDHFNVLSRCSNKKLKNDADKIFAAKIKVHSTKGGHEGIAAVQDTRTVKHQGYFAKREIDNIGLKTYLRVPNSQNPISNRDAVNPSLFANYKQVSTDIYPLFSSTNPPSSHDYINVCKLNMKHIKAEPLLERRKFNCSSRLVVPSLPKRGGDGAKITHCVLQKRVSSLVTDFHAQNGGVRDCKKTRKVLLKRRQNQQQSDQSPAKRSGSGSSSDESDHDVKPGVELFSSSSESDTVTGEKLPSSQDDGYSSNSLPSEASRKQLDQMNPMKDTSSSSQQQQQQQEARVEIVKIVPILQNFVFEHRSKASSSLQRNRLAHNMAVDKTNPDVSAEEEEEGDEDDDKEIESIAVCYKELQKSSCSSEHFDEETDFLDEKSFNNDVAPQESPTVSEDEKE